MYRHLLPFFLLIAFLPSPLYGGESIKCASTTSTADSGLLDYLLPIFTADSGIDVQIIAVGTGAALELGKKGDVDCVLVHDEELEKQLVEEGCFVEREDVMYNDFIILGPSSDPAGVTEIDQASEAFKKIRKAGAAFVSRGDNSGTNMRENRIWASSGKMPGRNDTWYHSTEQGMVKSIHIASEKQAYILSDRGTWFSVQGRVKSGLAIVLEGDPMLFNHYGVMIVNPAKHSHVDYRLAMNFVIWLTSSAGQQAIGAFKDASGNVLFTPNAR